MTQQETLWVVRRLTDRFADYVFKHPQDGELVAGAALDNPHMHKPEHFEKPFAMALALQLNAGLPETPWGLRIAPNRCPSCGRELWANDLDFCYPKNRVGTVWQAGCNVHDFGCGYHAPKGATYEEAISNWNGALMYDYLPGSSYSRVERKGLKALEAELQAVYEGYPEYHKKAKTDRESFDAMVGLFAADAFYNLHFVAKHYLHLQEPKEA